jgi:hypothetical protein
MVENGSCRVLELYCKTTVVGVMIPPGIGLLAIVASLCKGSFSLETWGAVVEFVVVGVIPSIGAVTEPI